VAMLRKDSVEIDNVEIKPLELARKVRQSKYEKTSGQQFLDATGMIFTLLSKMVESVVRLLNSVIMSYAFQMNDDSVSPIELASVEYASHFRIIEPKMWTTFNWIRVNNTHFPTDPFPTLSKQQIANVFNGALHYLLDKSVLHQWHLQRALYEWQNGSSANCVIYLVTSAEVLVREILTLYLMNEKDATSEIASERFEDLSFKKILVSEMAAVLGGKWNLNDEKSPLSSWYKGVYNLRNRVVHGGYSPTDKEMIHAIETSEEFRGFVHKRIANNLKKKPYLRILSPATGEARTVEREIRDKPEMPGGAS